MNKEQLKTKIYRKRDWGVNLPLHENLKGLENQVQDLSKFIIEDILKVDEEAEKRLTFFKENDFEQFKTDITIDADGIKTSVTNLREDMNTGLTENKSFIEQTATAIRTEVSASVTNLDGKISENKSSIEQTAIAIRSEVSASVTDLDGKISSNKSLIEQTATDINLKITDGDFLVSQINVGKEGVSISGNKIKLNENFIVDEVGNLCIKQISASLLTAGTIDADKIVVKNLKADSITTGSIITEKIEDGAITTDKICVEGLDAKVISAGVIDAQKVSIINLSAEQITVGKINGNQITSGSITGTQIKDGVITTEKIHVNGISADKITTGTLQVGNGLIVQGVINGNLAEFTNIKAQNITVGTINGTQISDNTLGNNHITDLSATKLTAGTINANIITVNNLNASNITSGTLHADRISVGSVSNDKLAGGITGDKMVPGTITGTQIANGVITTDKIAVNGISADKITTGTLNATNVSIINLNATNITSGTLSANRLNIGTEFFVDSTGKLTVKEISASKIKAGEIDASLITVKNLNADNITAGKLNGGNIGDDQIGNNHMKEISADKIKAGTITSSSFITTNGTETTTITGGKIVHSRNGQDITVFRNMRSGVVATDSSGSGTVTFSGMKTNLSVMTSIKSFNISQNIRSLHCYAEIVDIGANRWKFVIGGTESSSSGANQTMSGLTFSKTCFNLSVNSLTVSASAPFSFKGNLANASVIESYGSINIKIYYNNGAGSETLIHDENKSVTYSLGQYTSQSTSCGYGTTQTVNGYNYNVQPITISVNKTFTTFNSTNKTIRVVTSWSNNITKIKHTTCNGNTYTNYTNSASYNSCSTNISYTTEQIQNMIGSGEVQYTAMEQ